MPHEEPQTNGIHPKKRRLSPPWKVAEAQGPASFVEDGVRKSARTTRPTKDFEPNGRRPSRNRPISPPPTIDPPIRRPVGRPKKHDTPSHQSDDPASPKKSRLSDTLSRRSDDSAPLKKSRLSDTLSRRSDAPAPSKKPRLSLRFNAVTVSHPSHLVRRAEILADGALRRAKYVSFTDWFERDGRLDEDVPPPLSNEIVQREARIRHRLVQATAPDGILAPDRLGLDHRERCYSPPRLYTHHDRLLAHARRFQYLLSQERAKHIKNARDCAYQAAAFVRAREQRDFDRWKKEQPKTAEELLQDAQRFQQALRRQLHEDVRRKWAMVAEIVEERRLQRWQAEEDRRGKEALNQAIEKSRGLLNQRRRRNHDSSQSDEDSDENMSDDSRSTSEDEPEDEHLTTEQLRQKYVTFEEPVKVSPEEGLLPDKISLEEVDPMLLDDSNESDDSDSEESDESAINDAGSSEDSSDEDTGFGLLGGFLSKGERARIARDRRSDTATELYLSDDEADIVSLIPDPGHESTSLADIVSNAGDIPVLTHEPTNLDEPSPHLTISKKDFSRDEETLSHTRELTAIPSLLRGNLREYQHQGLDWLAGLYANGTNGILADEMGLGKTIQTISLLAHLAVHHEVWGPHLVVVPTSVMLNWEMEFKKFLPGFKVLSYYGSQEERKRKRSGWMDDNKWNVWITSYTLITQDQQVFKRKAWHYMILDEAHNIKNFQSQRWQTLLTFRTRARLLLTGTPLQNNLTELWSLLYFLMPSMETSEGILGFTSLDDFTGWFKRPTDQILQQGREQLDKDAQVAVSKLHDILRPYLLRRLKADVEKQMPGKYEHVVYCKLSKRQRYLYDGFMSRAQTKETMASGNTFSIMNALMQLRKVCNHPDLFETRQIVTSFAMSKTAVADLEIKDFLLRRRLQTDPSTLVDLNLVNLLPGENEEMSALDTIQRQRLGALATLRQLAVQQRARTPWQPTFDGTSVRSAHQALESVLLRTRYDRLCSASYLTSLRSQRRPLYSRSLVEQLNCVRTLPFPPHPPAHRRLLLLRSHISSRNPYRMADWLQGCSTVLTGMVPSLAERAQRTRPLITKFGCVTPAVVVRDLVVPPPCEARRPSRDKLEVDPMHESRMRLSIAFPDKRLLQYDCGKLQKLASLLRTLQAGGHRALIFTQMTRVLDILEQFLNIHGYRYLRLDGATKIEQRQVLTDRFNNDTRILAFILSSRSGGIGINLTGADSVIFYDMDWNPAMDKQCQDRAHRIGQVRDVHIYRFVSEHTIEANILRKANQKRLLDAVVIQQGGFTTDVFNNPEEESLNEAEAATSAAMDRVLGNNSSGRALNAVEDKEDVVASKEAEKEIIEDVVDFTETNIPSAAESERASCDEYMIQFWDWELRDVPVQPPMERSRDKKRKRPKDGIRR